jgi:hypothetical protein
MRHIIDIRILASVGLLAAGCGGGSATPVAPHIVPGGGIGAGPIAGSLNVYVTDDDTRAPVASAAVRIGASADPTPCMGVTDSTGLAVFNSKNCPSLSGPQNLTASANGYAPTTWIGANGTNVTIAIRAVTRPAVPSAMVSGTIDGWDSLPAPGQGHTLLGVVNYSQTRQLGDIANNIAQGMRNVAVAGGSSISIAANVCARNALVDDCAWQLTTRTGAQAIYAVILDQYNNGTPLDNTDDTFTTIGWAVKTGLDFSAGDSANAVTLEQVADADMQTLTAAIANPPAGFDALAAFPLLDIGDSGRIPITSPALDLTHTTTRIPKATGVFAGGTYDLLGQAQDAKDKPEPSTTAWVHAVDPSSTVAMSSWLPPPGGISATGGTYAFTPVPGATLHGAEIQNSAGDRLWSVTIFDGSTSFTLPGLTPDPVPAGMNVLVVSALQIPGIDLANVAFDDARERLTALSSDQITFTH